MSQTIDDWQRLIFGESMLPKADDIVRQTSTVRKPIVKLSRENT